MAKILSVTYNVPEEVKESIRISLAYFIMLAPGWVNHLYVDFNASPDKDDRGTLAEVAADYKYRRVYLTIFGRWLWENEQARKESIVHEAVHMLNAPIQNMVEEAIKGMFDGKVEKLFSSQWKIANEAATEDTARALIASGSWGEVELEPVEEIDQAQPPAEHQVEHVKPFVEKKDA